MKYFKLVSILIFLVGIGVASLSCDDGSNQKTSLDNIEGVGWLSCKPSSVVELDSSDIESNPDLFKDIKFKQALFYMDPQGPGFIALILLSDSDSPTEPDLGEGRLRSFFILSSLDDASSSNKRVDIDSEKTSTMSGIALNRGLEGEVKSETLSLEAPSFFEFDQIDYKEGGQVSGRFDLTFMTDCGPKIRSARLRGTFSGEISTWTKMTHEMNDCGGPRDTVRDSSLGSLNLVANGEPVELGEVRDVTWDPERKKMVVDSYTSSMDSTAPSIDISIQMDEDDGDRVSAASWTHDGCEYQTTEAQETASISPLAPGELEGPVKGTFSATLAPYERGTAHVNGPECAPELELSGSFVAPVCR